MAISNKQLMAFKKLGYTDAEIQQMLIDDKAVDRGQIMEWDLSPEEHKKAMKYANSTEKKPKNTENIEKKGKTVYNLDATGKKKKENPTKANIIALLATILCENGEFSAENVEITNKERQIAFTVGENAFELTLVQKRKPK
jgi:hypothetical protein